MFVCVCVCVCFLNRQKYYIIILKIIQLKSLITLIIKMISDIAELKKSLFMTRQSAQLLNQ